MSEKYVTELPPIRVSKKMKPLPPAAIKNGLLNLTMLESGKTYVVTIPGKHIKKTKR